MEKLGRLEAARRLDIYASVMGSGPYEGDRL